MKFNITLDPSATGILFSIFDGAEPSGALTYQINCGPIQTVGQPICLSGAGPHILTFCKPGANENRYKISSIGGVVASSNSPSTNSLNNLLCEGESLTLTASTIVNATYNWTGPNGFTSNLQNPTISNVTLAAVGTYTVQVTQIGGCSSPQGSTTVAINPRPPTPTASSNGPICVGSTLNLTSSTVTGATYNWTGPNGFTSSLQNPTIPNATLAASGDYFVSATLNGCTSNAAVTAVVINPIPVVTATPSIQTLCSGETSAINLASNVPSTTFTWTVTSSGVTGALPGSGNVINQTLTATGTTSGTVTYNITPSANSCTGTPITVTITVNPRPIINPATPNSQTICAGSGFSIPLTSNISGTTFSWTVVQNGVTGAIIGSGNEISQTLSTTTQTVGTATYTVTPRLNGCDGTSFNIVITVNPLPTVNPISNINVCANSNISEQILSSLPAGATFTWTNNNPNIGLAASGNGNIPAFTALNNTSSNLVATISITPTLNNCIGPVLSYIVTVRPLPVVNAPSNMAVCAETVIPSIAFSSIPLGATFNWTNSNTSIGLSANGTGNVPSFTALNSSSLPLISTITVIPSINGCIGQAVSFTITVSPKATIVSAIPTAVTSCMVNNGSILITATGVAPLAYSINGGSTFQNSGSFSGLASGSYAIAVRNGNSCITYGSILFVGNPTPPPAPLTASNSPICEGSTLTLSISNQDASLTYNWIGPNGFSATGSTISRANTTLNMAGSYAVTATLNDCVSNSTIVGVVINALPLVSVPSNIIYCNGVNVPSTNFTSTPNGATYNWTNSNPTIGLAANGTGNVPSFITTNNSLVPITATITVTPTLNNCIGPSSSYTITVNPKVIVTATPPSQTVCSGTAPMIQLSSNTMGTTYRWTVVQTGVTGASAGTGSVINQTITAVSGTAVYTITPNANGCDGDPINVTITVNPIPIGETTVADNQSICSGSITNIPLISNVNGTTFTWTVVQNGVSGASNGSGTNIAQTLLATGTTEGTVVYTITPIASICTGTPMILTVRVRPLPTVSIPNSFAVCSGNSVQATNFSSEPSGATYDWTSTNPAVGLVASGGGNVPSFFAVNNGNTSISTIITVTPTLNGCRGPSASYRITVNPLPRVVEVLDMTVCEGNTVPQVVLQSLPLNATYTWTNSNPSIGLPASGTGNIPAFTAINNSNGTSLAIITIFPTLNQCAGPSSNYIVTINKLPVITLTPSAPQICFGSDVLISASGAQSYVWSPLTNLTFIDGATMRANPITTTTYTVTGTDANGCSSSKNVTINVSLPLVITNIIEPVTCRGNSDGKFIVGITGGNAPYSISYVNSNRIFSVPIAANAGFNTISGVPAGNYTIRVIDRLGCIQELSAIVTEPSAISATFTSVNSVCRTSPDGSATVTPVGGNAPYRYQWLNQNGTNATLSNMPSGNYTVIITDAKNCTLTSNVTILANNCAPIALNDNFTTLEDTPITRNVGINDSDPDGDPLRFFIQTNPANGTIIFNADGSFTFTPNPNWNGTTTFDYRVCDPAGLCTNATVTIIVSPTNDPPIAQDDLFTGTEDVPLNRTVIVNDSDIDGDVLNFDNVTEPANGTLIFNADGTFVFTPNPNWNGTTNFEYVVCDPAGLCDRAIVTIIIVPANDPPIAEDDSFFVLKNSAFTESVVNNDIDIDGDVLSFNRVTNPGNGALVFNTNGTFTYTPNINFTGIDTYIYRACDPSGLCDNATVTFLVQPQVTVNLTPTIGKILEGENIKVTATLTEPLLQDVFVTLRYGGTANNGLDYNLTGSFITIRFLAGETTSTDTLTIHARNDDLKEFQENVLIEVESTSSVFVTIGIGSDIAIIDVYPVPIPYLPSENPDINPDPLTSPNNDGQGNDAFVIYNISKYPDNEVVIFNRWGNAVYKIKNYDNKDNAFKGFANTGLMTNLNEALVDGVYYYVIHTIYNDEKKINKGYLILKR